MNHAATPQRLQTDGLILEEVRDELLVYDPQRNKAFCLNQTAARVWKHSDGKTPVSEIARRIEGELGKPVTEPMVWFALDVLAKDGLLAPSTFLPPPGMSRRHLLQKMGMGAMALPAVTVLFVSPAKAHASSRMPETDANANTPLKPQHSGGFWQWLEDLF
jgi:hypothetical protein